MNAFGPVIIERPRNLAQMPYWPGLLTERTAAKTVINLAIAAEREKPSLAIGVDFPDGTSMALEYIIDKRSDVPPEVWDHVGPPPLMSIVVIDHGVGWHKDRGGISRFDTPNDAETALKEIALVLGKDDPKAVYGESINPERSRRRYFWRVQ